MAKIKESNQKLIFLEILGKIVLGKKMHFFHFFFNAVGFSRDICVISSGHYDNKKVNEQICIHESNLARNQRPHISAI